MLTWAIVYLNLKVKNQEFMLLSLLLLIVSMVCDVVIVSEVVGLFV
jgi:hypothetical protein